MPMKEYRFSYQSIIRFETPVREHYFRLRCLPCNNDCQQVVEERLEMRPSVSLREDTDAFGNRIQYGHTLEEHDAFVFCSSGRIRLDPYALREEVAPVYRTESRFTQASAEMKEFARRACPPLQADGTSRATALTEAVHRHMAYMPGTTDNRTTAAEAFIRRQGVCQDYTHILISLCRLVGLPARYANGFLTGIGLTHAWAEVFCDGTWRGFDPTNNTRMDYGYIKLGHGRDAADCPVNRGVFIGGGGQCTEVRVLTEEIKNEEQEKTVKHP